MSKTVLHQILGRAGFSAVTKRNYERIIDRWIEFAGAEPTGWTLDKAQDFYDQLIAGGLSVPSVNVYMDSLRYVSKWYATKSGGVDFAIVQRQRGTKGHTREREGGPILDEDEAKALLETCREPTHVNQRDLAMLVTMLETGMRRMSIRGMRIDGFKKGPAVTIPIKGPGGEETFDVPLSDTAHATLVSWIAQLRKNDVSSDVVFRRLSPRVGSHGQRHVEIGDSLSLTGINEIIEGRAKIAGIRHINPHMFRHTFISWRSMAGFSPLDIAQITGHKVRTIITADARMNVGAMQTYLHRDIHAIRNATPPWLVELVKELLQ